ncbi:hypothetical protein [Nitrococcus mobilis]|uniref:Transposase n=1 Tax=Nitrococcus mobilis Nb-231 TaxID=314278 RepID=A4BNB0_9GAMM|nr:hypothetical protein [Nitrococcus mobilis]EAR22709.1 hypothetical protein NB231_09663 [Nitrococcus mobilis Nb-231]
MRPEGAFWEDRYRATAVDSAGHWVRCLAYIDLNMVRAGAVRHPEAWDACGSREIQRPPKRYAVIDRDALAALLGLTDSGELASAQTRGVADALRVHSRSREPVSTERLAAGRQSFVEEIRLRLGISARYRSVTAVDGAFSPREPAGAYAGDFDPETTLLSS